jgi:hypothetical protein
MNNSNLLWRLIKLSFPLSIVLFLILAIYGYLQPWQPAVAILSSYSGQSPIMVGFAYGAENNHQISSRSYILFPSIFSEPKIVTIAQTNQSNPVVSSSFFGFLFSVGWLIICFFGTWWFWLRPFKHLPPNTSFKLDA